MIVIVPVCHKDEEAALRNLAWAKRLDGGPVAFDCLVTHDDGFDPSKVVKAAKEYFQAVRLYRYPVAKRSEWPYPQNNAFIQTAAWVFISEKQRWLWWEQDAVPLKASWLSTLQSADLNAGKMFFGTRSTVGSPHLSGVAIYPFNVPMVIPDMAFASHIPFDLFGGQRVLQNAAVSDLIQHVWSWRDNAHDAPAPTFVGKDDLAKINPQAVLFHRCKDDSLVKALSSGTSLSEVVQKAKVSLIQVLMRWKYGTGKWKVKESTRRKVNMSVTVYEPRLVHCLERHKQTSKDAERRVAQAQESWVTLYKTGVVVPAHVWEPQRHSAQVGDSRQLPYLKDVLLAGLNGGGKNDCVMWTNDDTILHPSIAAHLLELMADKPAVSSFRINFDKDGVPPLSKRPGELLDLSRALHPPGDIDLGRDLFAFRKDWLREHWHEIPDFLLGELEFDLVLAFLIRKTCGIQTTKLNMDKVVPECELTKGYVLHERHHRTWTSPTQEASPAKQWNRKLATEFYCDNDLHSLITNKL